MLGFLKRYCLFQEVDGIERIEIDNSRKLLYVLTEKGSIEAFDIGPDYSKVRSLGKISQNDITNQAVRLIT